MNNGGGEGKKIEDEKDHPFFIAYRGPTLCVRRTPWKPRFLRGPNLPLRRAFEPGWIRTRSAISEILRRPHRTSTTRSYTPRSTWNT